MRKSDNSTPELGYTGGHRWPAKRTYSLLTGDATLEEIASLPRFPVYMGCVNEPADQDIFVDMNFDIPRDTGAIQLQKLPPLELVYLTPHADAIGQTWQMHHQAFASFVGSRAANNVLEIGGGAGALAAYYLEQWPDAHWVIIEPNGQPLPDSISESVAVLNEYLRPGLQVGFTPDTVVCSHVLEHSDNPVEFLRNVATYLPIGGLFIISVPNMKEWLSRKYASCLNFEHTVLLTEPMLDALLKREGFEILEKDYVGDSHSIFYRTKYTGKQSCNDLPQEYHSNKRLFVAFLEYYRNLITTLNSRLARFDGPVYLFGAHVAVPFLLSFGLDQTRITGILDNSKLKCEKRLYGTSFEVSPPEVIREEPKAGVVITVPPYRDEIIEQLMSLNPLTTIIE